VRVSPKLKSYFMKRAQSQRLLLLLGYPKPSDSEIYIMRVPPPQPASVRTNDLNCYWGTELKTHIVIRVLSKCETHAV